MKAMSENRLAKVLDAIDRVNQTDPKKYEFPYSQWVTEWVKKLEPNPSEELLIAARGQHIARWEIPRDSFPDDRKSYLAWREKLKGMHAEKIGALMREAGYPAESIAKVERIILKKNLRDPESQIVEDALCLVFLEHQFTDLLHKEPEATMVEILRKTWRKMGEKGRAAAMTLSLTPEQLTLVQKALSPA